MLEEIIEPLFALVPSAPQDTVRELLTEILGHDPAPDQPLRECGLDSIAAARLRAELDLRFGVLVPMAALSRCRGAAELAGLVTGLDGTARPGPRPDDPGPRPNDTARFDPFDLTTIQQAYLVGKDPDFTTDPIGCHLYREFEVADADPERLRAAWERVLAEQDMLRTVVTDDGRQRVLREVPAWQLPVRQAGMLLATRERLSHRCYDPGQWPLFDIEMTRHQDGSATVHLSLDALLTDGPGLDHLLESWWRYYRDPDYRDPAEPAAAVTPRARDCLRWLAEHGAAARRRDLGHWARRLASLPPGPSVTAVPRPTGACHRRTALDDELDGARWAALRRRADDLEVSVSALVLAVFAATLRCHQDQGCHQDHEPADAAFSLVLTTSTRSQLPGGIPQVVAPFTSTAIVVIDGGERGTAELARLLHDRLWEDLDHQSVSAVEALREVLGAGAVPLPVVFTSLLDTGRHVPPGSFGDSVSYTLSQTSDVAIDCQIGEVGGRLRVHWDLAAAMLRPGIGPVLFARFMNGLVACGLEADAERRPLNELQQAYHVSRSGGPAPWDAAPWDGCQVYQAIEVDDLDLPRLAAAWAGMMRDHEALRSCAVADGEIRVLPGWPAGWRIPEVVLDSTDQDFGSRLRTELVSRAFRLDDWPQFDLRVTRRGSGPAIVHLTLDLLLLDGRSTHLVARELLARYAGNAVPAAAAAVPAALAAPGAADQHWRNRVSTLPPGPRLRPYDSAASKARIRRNAVVAGWGQIRERLRVIGICPDAALTAALAAALAPDFGEPFAVTLVRWSADTEPARPAEHTRLSWLVGGPGDYWPAARAMQQAIEADAAADAVSGLAHLRRAVLKRRGTEDASYPIVHTGLLELAGRPWPPGARLLDWATCTPDVAMDCIAMEEGDGVLRVFWDVVDDQFAPGQAERIFERYVSTVQGLAMSVEAAAAGDAASPVATVAAVVAEAVRDDRLSPGERDAMLRAWNDTARPYTADGPVHLLFEERAAAAPGATAVRCRGGTLTYRELNRWANAIAAKLLQGGWPGTGTPVVAVSTRRGPQMIAAVLGVLKAGGAYLPIDPKLPADRALGMLDDADAVAVLVSEGERGWAPPARLPAFTVDTDQEITAARDRESADRNPPPSASADSLAYIIYTSGSTGRPKGVAVTHRPVHNLLQWAARVFRFTPDDIGLCVTSLGFDLSVFDIFGLLGYGASVYVADSEEQADPGLLIDILLDQRITFWNSAPTTLSELAPLLPAASARTTALRLVFLSGDWTPLTLPERLRSAFPRMLLVSLGGATEATVWSNYFPVIGVDPQWRSVPYGRPIDNSRYYVLDENLVPCPPGEEGDLYIAGVCLAVGYLGRPGLTAERFVADPFAAMLGGRPGERMYRTGDRALYTRDGTIVFRGRLDSQVKIRGFRVELGEVEHRLRNHPDVLDVVALAREDPDGNKVLVAYVRSASPRLQAADLRSHTAQALPAYMVPSHVIVVDAFPATANGKLDRKALPAPGATPAAPPPDVPHSLGIEALTTEIAALFRAHIGAGELDLAADLWDQGATSFTMVRVSAALKKKYRERIPVSTLLETPTINGVARAVAAIVTGPPTREHPPAPPVPPPPPAPPAGERPQLEVDLLDDDARKEFLAARWNRRAAARPEQVTSLPRGASSAPRYDRAAARRTFAGGPVPLASLGALLELLSQEQGERGRYRYPSAGRTYAVQSYVHVRDGGVAGLRAGVYYYRPDAHSLELVGDGAGIDYKAHFFYNRDIYQGAAFQLFLVGQARAIEPLYGPDAQLFLAVEAGYIGQLLLEHQTDLGIGLCPIGTVAFDRIRPALGLDEGHRFLHAFLGGLLVPGQATAVPPVAGIIAGTAAAPVAAPEPARHAAAGTVAAGAVAVTGMAGRFGPCADLEEYWQLLSEGRTAFVDWPRRRGPVTPATAPAGGYLPEIAPADTMRFGISPAEARTLDPQLWLLLDAASRCVEDAGLTPSALRAAGRVGVFVATMWPDGQVAGADRWRSGEGAHMSGIAADLPNRVSHIFGFCGPSMAVNTSCSSALTALHLARLSLTRGECDAAIVAAVNVIAHPYHLALLDGLALLAGQPAGAFCASNTGWTPGEGAGAVLLRPEAAARADGDPVQAVIESSWTGHAGTTQRFGAPSAAALRDCLRDGLRAAGLGPSDIDYVECAAAGAPIADAAEVEALGTLLASAPLRGRPVRFGTVKPNVGHLEAASGMSQLAKVLLQLREGAIAPTLAAADRNPLVSWDPDVLRLATEDAGTEGAAWRRGERGRPRRALVNALGATGSYAHVIVTEPGTRSMP